ncbi:MAG: hypothetical protein AAGA56_17960 [Myxococcota bacterium]
MKRARLRLGLAFLLVGAACGGSSSESPWPVEPDPEENRPAGETKTDEPLDVSTLPNRYPGPGGSAEPIDEPAPGDVQPPP